MSLITVIFPEALAISNYKTSGKGRRPGPLYKSKVYKGVTSRGSVFKPYFSRLIKCHLAASNI